MNLELHPPSYFSTEHGIDDEIYWFLRGISKYFFDKEYSEIVNKVSIMSIVAPDEIIRQGKWQEHISVYKSIECAYVAKQTDYTEYLNADMEGRKKLMVENILGAIKSIRTRAKFDYVRFEKDLLSFVENFNMETIDKSVDFPFSVG